VAMLVAATAASTSSQRFRRVAGKTLAVAATCGLAALAARAGASLLQGALLYHPRALQGDPYYSKAIPEMARRLQMRGYTMEEFTYTAGVDLKQRAFLLQPSKGKFAGPLWLVFGGNAMLSADWLEFCDEVITLHQQQGQANAAFLLVDYPGYGGNPGRPSP
ncbi:unnamed protein product, partial [Polarella glacialis]